MARCSKSPVENALASSATLCLAGFPRRNPVLYALLALLLASAALNALGRGYIAGADYALHAVRYRFYASAVLAVTYLCWAEWVAARGAHDAWQTPLGQRFLAASLAGALVFSSASYGLYTPKAVEVSEQLHGGLRYWRSTGRGLRHPDAKHAGAILERAIEEGLYLPHPRSF